MESKNSIKLLIDADLITPGWMMLRSFEEIKEYITTNEVPRLIDFGYELRSEDYESRSEYTGYDLIKWLIQADMDGEINIPSDFTFKVHAYKNPDAITKMETTLKDYLDYRDDNCLV
jgi:hypothetical protein